MDLIKSYHTIKGDAMKLNLILGKNIKYHRYEKGYSQERLAERLNVSPNYIGRIERGQHTSSLDKIEKIAKFLNIKPYELFIERDDFNKLPIRINLKK